MILSRSAWKEFMDDGGDMPDDDTIIATMQSREQEIDAMLAALEAQEKYVRRLSNPFGHDCGWCLECVTKVDRMRHAAILLAKGEKS